MATHKRTWKKAEQRVAKLFGTRRRRGSGSDPETGGDDILHDRLHVEVKYREKQAVMTTYRDAKEKADSEGKMPIVVLLEKRSPVILLVLPLDKETLKRVLEEME